MNEELGLIHIYCGDGKGKTSAAMGLVIRAAGNNLQVLILQLLKIQYSGELTILGQIPNIKVIRGKGVANFSFTMTEPQKLMCRNTHNHNLEAVIAEADHYDLLVLDEVIGAYNRDLLDKDLLLDFLKNKPPHLEVVLTGRNPPEEILEFADYISEIKKVKHPFDKGVKARLGIER